ncbi:MAG TPA: N-acetyltransferase [Brevundimonas sp.]|nr:N-acetyltransferase [Brevundimonas sp.]
MSDTAVKPAPPRIEIEATADAPGVDALVLAAFGPGRFAKTAERLREKATVAAAFVARDGGRIVGSVRLWNIRIGDTPAVFLGPIAVADDHRKGGLGAELVRTCVARAQADGADILLVGDTDYFGRFGFAPASGVQLPGPVDAGRILWRGSAAPVGRVQPVRREGVCRSASEA